ncbi:alpha/beta-gliadin A-III-like [Perca fluviatilis]|uniref:alpha/beta-gliadin A-III-like n=1 Tax=Perca fluviatilis TaxID=8168 RepID=UPI001963859E|nr:alpha/beta-gliadin A-III-like [Perca fluviatilis]
MPILFFSQRHKGTGKLVANVVTHLPPTQTNTRLLTSMKKAYDFIIKLDDVPQPQPQQDQPLTQDQLLAEDQPLAQDQPLSQDQPLAQDQHLAQYQHLPQDQHLPLDQPIPQNQPTPPDQQLITLNLFPIPPDSAHAQLHMEPLPPRKRQSREAPPSTLAKKKKTKSCKCSRQTIYPYEKILERRMNGGKAAEVKVRWLPCASCGRVWEDTWEPASKFA